MWGDIAIAFVLAFITTFVVTPYTIKLAKKVGAVDTPKDARRVNKVTMPRLGGLAIIAGFLVSIIYLLIILSVENTINILEDNNHMKLLGFLIGGLIIYVINWIGAGFNFALPLEWWSAILVGLLGIPGAVILVLIQLFM